MNTDLEQQMLDRDDWLAALERNGGVGPLADFQALMDSAPPLAQEHPDYHFYNGILHYRLSIEEIAECVELPD